MRPAPGAGFDREKIAALPPYRQPRLSNELIYVILLPVGACQNSRISRMLQSHLEGFSQWMFWPSCSRPLSDCCRCP